MVLTKPQELYLCLLTTKGKRSFFLNLYKVCIIFCVHNFSLWSVCPISSRALLIRKEEMRRALIRFFNNVYCEVPGANFSRTFSHLLSNEFIALRASLSSLLLKSATKIFFFACCVTQLPCDELDQKSIKLSL